MIATSLRGASAIVDRAQARANTIIIPVVRIIVGLLWLQNAGWKTPPDFGKTKRPRPVRLHAISRHP